MASVKSTVSTSISTGSAGAKKPSSGPAPGASSAQVSSNVPQVKPPAAPKAPTVKPPTLPKAPAAPKTPIAKSINSFDYDTKPKPTENTLDYKKINANPPKPEANTLDYKKINEIKQKPAGETLDYSKINAKQPQPEPKVLDYKSMQSPKPWSGAVEKLDAVNAKIDKEANQPALDSIKARRMFRAKYLREKINKTESKDSTVKKTCSALIHKDELHETCMSKDEQKEVSDKNKKDAKQADKSVKEKRDTNGEFAKSLKEYVSMKKPSKEISKSERDFIKEDLGRPYTPYFNDVDDLVKKEFKPLEEEILLDVAIRFEKGEIVSSGEKLEKADPLDKYKIDKGGSLKFGTHVKTVGFPRNTLDSKENPKAGSDEGSGGQISKAGVLPTKTPSLPKMAAPAAPKMTAPAAPKSPAMGMPKMTKAEIEAECKEDFKPKFKK